MKRLLLLRHAKAETGDAIVPDKARKLATRGREDASLIGDLMTSRHYLPERVLCSTAARTMETWALLASELHNQPALQFVDSLYLAPPKAIIGLVRHVGETDILLVIGHNPGLEECAMALIRKTTNAQERQRAKKIAGKFPTGALAVLDFNIRQWQELEEGTGALIDFVQPKDLRAE
jgi:phosphohistidine phosphatase